jgi:hypothetical protein
MQSMRVGFLVLFTSACMASSSDDSVTEGLGSCELSSPLAEDPLLHTGSWLSSDGAPDGIVELGTAQFLDEDRAIAGGVGGLFVFEMSASQPELLGRWQ